MARGPGIAASRERRAAVRELLSSSFGLPAGLAMLAGVVLGFGLPAIDDLLDADLPLFAFSSQDAARGLLETIATVTVAVAGLSFSVTIVAFTLSANQLSPRVLRSFRRDRVSQLTLASFLGSFIYCLAVLVRLGTLGPERVPNLSITLAALLALFSFGIFAWFIGHITDMLQPSSVIASIAADALPEQRQPFPAGAGSEPDDRAAARAEADQTMDAGPGTPVRVPESGYLTLVRAQEIVEGAQRRDGLVRQEVPVGRYLLQGETVAWVWAPTDAAAGELVRELASSFELGRQRTLPQDPGFPIRQLADVALKGLSPGINDPTTARTALEAMTSGLVRVARSDRPSPVRTDAGGRPRLVASVPSFDDLVRLGFDQVRTYAASDHVVLCTLLDLLERLGTVAAEQGLSRAEADRQATLIADAAGGERPTSADLAGLRDAGQRAIGG